MMKAWNFTKINFATDPLIIICRKFFEQVFLRTHTGHWTLLLVRLDLQAPIPQNGQTHSSVSQIVSVHLPNINQCFLSIYDPKIMGNLVTMLSF